MTIPDSSVISSPSAFAEIKVTYVLSFSILVLLPLFALIISFIIGLIPIRHVLYRQRVRLLFLIITLLFESISLYELIKESRYYY